MQRHVKQFADTVLPGASRAYRRVRDYARFKRLKPYQTTFGFSLYGDAGLDTSRTDEYEAPIFLSLLEKTDVVIDVGANVGLFTCLAAQHGKKVLAFEPHPYNTQCLYRNLQMNGFANVEVYPIALSNQIGVASLFGGGQGATLVPGWAGIQSTYHHLTPLNTLDNVVAHRFAGQQLLVKVDVEGNEFTLLQEAHAVLKRTPAPFWIVEHGLTENYDAGLNPHFEALFNVFWQQGYEAFTVDAEQRLVTTADVKRWVAQGARDFGAINYLFKHPSRTSNA